MSEFKIEYIQTKNNLETVMVNGYLLHSKYNPLQEAKLFSEREINQEYVHILFGYGLGYISNEILKLLKNKENLVIVDPLINKLKCITSELDENRIISNLDAMEIKKLLFLRTENYNRKIKVICSPNYDKILPKDYLKLLKIVKDFQNTSIVNENTIRLFSRSWQENYIKNLIFMCEDVSLSELIGKYTLPVVIASGGPSLTKQLPKLKEISSKCVVIAAGSTINSLIAADIEPDFVVSIDGAPENHSHFQDLKLKKAKLMYSIGNYYKIQEEFNGNRIAFIPMKEERLQNYIKNKFSVDLPIVLGGGTVANFALHIATLITNGPIAIIGQDLAYTNNEVYAKNNKNFKEFSVDILNEIEFIETDGYYGEKVLTTYEYIPMKESFEIFMKSFPVNNTVYNCTEGGVKINGMKQMPFNDFCRTYIQHLDSAETDIPLKNNSVKKETFIGIMQKELQIYKEMKSNIKIAIKEVEATKNIETFTPKTLKVLEKIDNKLKKNFNKAILERIADPIILDVLRNFNPVKNENQLQMYERIYSQNMAIYSGLLYAVEQTELFVKEAIEMEKNRDK